MVRLLFIFSYMLAATSSLYAADSLRLITTISMQANLLSVDESGNAYVVRDDNTLIMYNENGDSMRSFRSAYNGAIGFIDAVNPLRIIAYYPRFAKIVLLDRMLSVKNELDLRKLNIMNSSTVAASADGSLWVYDLFGASLNKVDMQLNYAIKGNDLRQVLSYTPSPSYITEREQKVYLCDTNRGILVFDRYGSYINTISITRLQYLQVTGSQLIYRRSGTLVSYDMNTLTTKEIGIPSATSTVITAATCRGVLYVLYKDRLVLYRIGK